MSFLSDSINNQITLNCINGANFKQLSKAVPHDLVKRLDVLVSNHILKYENELYNVAFPVFIGKKRDRLNIIVAEKSKQLLPIVEILLTELKESIKPAHSEKLFHLLWSRILDEAWETIWESEFSKKLAPSTVWCIWPHHDYAVGTNYNSILGDGNIAMTWSDNFQDHIEVINDYLFELNRIAWEEKIDDLERIDRLVELGLLDAEKRLLIFKYNYNDEYYKLFWELIKKYSASISKHVDLESLAVEFDLDAEQFAVIFLYELAYEIFKELDRNANFEMPNMRMNNMTQADTKNFVSLMLNEKPKIEDVAMDLFMENDWKGNEEIILEFEKVLKYEPSNYKIMYYLGFSLFEVGRHEDSIKRLTILHEKTKLKKKVDYRRAWSLIWIGHNYDLMGKREEAIKNYRRVFEFNDDGILCQMPQYNINRVTAWEWAKRRIAEPFTK